jgi:hypothetical protein
MTIVLTTATPRPFYTRLAWMRRSRHPGHEVDLFSATSPGGKIYMMAHVITDPSNKNAFLC